MSFSLPVPRKPAVGLSDSSARVAKVESWDYDNWRFPDHYYNFEVEDWVSRVAGRTSNGVILLGGDVPWRPISSYQRSVWKVAFPDGVQITNWTWGDRKGQPGSIYSGPSNRGGMATPSGPFLTSPAGFARDMTWNERNRLSTELLMKVGSRKASYGESLGEARKTASHLGRTVSTVVRAALAARKGNWRGVANALGVRNRQFFTGKSAAERWLEYQYGWLPLLGDIYDTYELLQKGFRKEKTIMSSIRVITYRHSGSEWKSDAWNERYSGQSEMKTIGKVYYSVNESTLAKWNQIGLINPLEVAWALTPYSFLIDWFLPVGNVLEALTAPIGVEFIDGYFAVRVEGGYTAYPGRLNGMRGDELAMNTLSSSSEFLAYSREKLAGFPLPGLYVKNPFSTNHLTSALALLRQLSK